MYAAGSTRPEKSFFLSKQEQEFSNRGRDLICGRHVTAQVLLKRPSEHLNQSFSSKIGPMSSSDIPGNLLRSANTLLYASHTDSLEFIAGALSVGAPAWYQDPQLGWSCLHYAAERREPELLRVLLRGGAVWNAVDRWGRTAGEVCLSLGDQEGWEIIRNEGIRSGERMALFDYRGQR